MSWTIKKQFHAEYGHRVWSQKLDQKYSLDDQCVCRHLHGHSLLLEVSLKGETLEQGMVTDFKHLNCLKKFIDDVIDHKFIVDSNDPLFEQIVDPRRIWAAQRFIHPAEPFQNLYRVVNKAGMYPPDLEYYESFVIVDFVPTSENLAQWIYKIASSMLGNLATIYQVDWHETAKTCATFKLEF